MTPTWYVTFERKRGVLPGSAAALARQRCLRPRQKLWRSRG
jgi:hypothetical protein